MSSALAINGGSPVRSVKYLARHHFDQDLKQTLGEILDRAVLSGFYGADKVREFEAAFAGRLAFGSA
jgi:hypothetical protein